MANYVSVRIKSIKTCKSVQQLFHDLRLTAPGYLAGDDYDSSTLFFCGGFEGTESEPLELHRTGSVAELKGSPEAAEMKKQLSQLIRQSAREQQTAAQEKTGRKSQATANYFVSGIITFSANGVRDADPAEVQKLAQQTIRQLCSEWGVRPLYVSAHSDETVLHLHFCIENINRDSGRSVARKIGREGCSHIQDVAGEIFSTIGLSRGVSRDVTGKKYKTVSEGHRMLLAAGERDLSSMHAQLEMIKTEIRATRLTAEQRQALEKNEKLAHDKTMAELRRQQRELRESIKSAEAAAQAELQIAREQAEAKKSALIGKIKSETAAEARSIAAEADATKSRAAAEIAQARSELGDISAARSIAARGMPDYTVKKNLFGGVIVQENDWADAQQRLEAGQIAAEAECVARAEKKAAERKAKEAEARAAEEKRIANQALSDRFELGERVRESEAECRGLVAENQRLKQFVRARGLENDYEDWAAAYQLAQRELERPHGREHSGYSFDCEM